MMTKKANLRNNLTNKLDQRNFNQFNMKITQNPFVNFSLKKWFSMFLKI